MLQLHVRGAQRRAVFCLAFATSFWAFSAALVYSQTSTPAPVPAAGTIPEIVVNAPKPKPRARRHAAKPSTQSTPANAALASIGRPATGVSLQTAASLSKTGTALADLPQSVVVVPRARVTEQGGYSVRDALRDVSGVNEGGSSSYGFFDRFTVRGLDARIYSDGFPDGDQFNGFPHSLNGVERIEVLKGPGSALFGSGPPGGTINIVHFQPSATPAYGIGTQIGSFGSWLTSVYATGPTTAPGLTYRVDGLLQHSDGFRSLESANYELRPVMSWTHDNHVTNFALDLRHIERTPDSYGIVYVGGPPLASVPNTAKYSTPFAFGDQNFERGTVTDAWWITNYLTINNRLSFVHRDVDILRNSGGKVTGTMLTSRQLREQTDHDKDLTYQLEPIWKFYTGSIGHTLLTGVQVEWQGIDDNRATADLPNIANIYAPVVPETSTAGLTFLRDAKHSGMIDDLRALYVSAYTTDQIDVTDRWKVRLGVRQDYWLEDLTPQVFVPGRFDPNGNLFLPGVTESRADTPVSWSVGTLYKLLPGVAPFAGVAKSYLTNFNSEATQTGIYAPESGLEYEAGAKFSTADNSIVLTAAAFEIYRANVFTENAATVPIQISFNSQVSRGFDGDVQLQITPQWKLFANGIVQNAVLTAVPLTPSQGRQRPGWRAAAHL